MKRRNFFKAMGVALATPSILMKIAETSKPIHYTQGIKNFIRGAVDPVGERPEWIYIDDMEVLTSTQPSPFPVAMTKQMQEAQDFLNETMGKITFGSRHSVL